MDYQKVLKEIYENIIIEENLGEVASYIPELSKVNPDKFGICLKTIDTEE